MPSMGWNMDATHADNRLLTRAGKRTLRTLHVRREVADEVPEVAELGAQLEFGAVQQDVQYRLRSGWTGF